MWRKRTFSGVLMQADLTVSATVKWKHPEQTRELAAHLIEDLHADRVEVAMEPSGTYGDALYGYLSGLGVAIYRVSPKRVHDAAEVYDGVPSLHDAKSAYIIARLHLDGGSSLWEEIPEQRRERQALIGELDLYQDQQQRNRNRLEALLSRHWPEATRVMELKRVSLLAVLTEYGDPATITAHSEEAWELMRHNGRGLLSGETIGKVLESPSVWRAPKASAIWCKYWQKSCCARTGRSSGSRRRSIRRCKQTRCSPAWRPSPARPPASCWRPPSAVPWTTPTPAATSKPWA